MEANWINNHIIWLIIHIFGSVLGAGAAFTGDVIFLTSIKNGQLRKNELKIMQTVSRVFWIGLLILLISGIGLVMERPEILLNSQKFWAKMTVLAVIIGNGLLFHFLYFPILQKGIDRKLTASNPIINKRSWLVISGAISVTSWTYTIVLGVLARTPFSYMQFITLYLSLLLLSCGIGILLRKRLISLTTT